MTFAVPEATIKIAPYEVGARTPLRCMVRRTDMPSYLCLSTAEINALNDLRDRPVAVSEFLAQHLSGNLALDFRMAVALLIRLHQHHFVLNASDETVARLNEFSERATNVAQSGLRRFLVVTKILLDAPVIEFRSPIIHPFLRRFGKFIVSTPFVAGVGILLLILALYTGISSIIDPTAYKSDFREPENLILKGFFSFSIALSWIAFIQMAALAGTGAKFVGGAIRLTGGCVIRLAVIDTDALMLPRGKMLRYHLLTMLTPWLSALAAWQLAGEAAFTSFAGLFSGVFAIIGFVMICPLIKSPIVKLAEGFVATDNIFDRANAFLSKGLFNFRTVDEKEEQDKATNLWVTGLATLSIAWLYGMSLTFFDALLSATADLSVHLFQFSRPVRAFAAAFVLLVLVSALLAPLTRLVMIPLQNLVALAYLPMRRARRSISSYYSPTISPTDAVVNFLREIPILADMDDQQLRQLIPNFKYERVAKGRNIITRGEQGFAFYILADGQAQVIVGGGENPEDVIDVLSPGDSFGEIALIEKVLRTATIRAVQDCKLLVLDKLAFDRLFVEGSEVRERLTHTIRMVKLVLESQTMSHLTPRQIRELLRSSETMSFKAGDYIIREQESGDAAYLIKSGKVLISKDGQAVATAGRGDLVGAIALLKEVRRTASVVAELDTECLKISKETFLKMCMSNMFVALLVSDLSEKQLAESRAG